MPHARLCDGDGRCPCGGRPDPAAPGHRSAAAEVSDHPPDGDAIDKVALLNPNLTRQQRQRGMARWLMPFGFLAGVTFTKITTLTTFASFGPWGETLIGGLLGMGSGLMGSYAAAASVDSDNDAGVRILRNRRDEGRWLVLLETPNGIEAPWQVIQKSRPQQVVRLNDL